MGNMENKEIEVLKNNINIIEKRDLSIIEEININKKIAEITKEIILKNTIDVNNNKYVMVAGLKSLATVLNLKTKIVSIEKTESGYLSYCEVYDKNNNLLSSSYGFCGFDEDLGRKRKEFEIISMSQTRAIGRALRDALSFIINYLNLSYTIFEDMPEDIINSKPQNNYSNFNKTQQRQKIIKQNNQNSESDDDFTKYFDFDYDKNINSFENTVKKIIERNDKKALDFLIKSFKNYSIFANANQEQKNYIINLINEALKKVK